LPDHPHADRPHADFTTYDYSIEDLMADPSLAAESIGAAVAVLADHRVTVAYVGPDRESPSHVWSIAGADLTTAADALDVDVLNPDGTPFHLPA
jgi:hypothetical protein